MLYLYRTSSPLLFSQLLSYWSVERPIDKLTATYYALGLIATNWLFAFFGHHGNLYCQQYGMKLRVATSSLMFRKVSIYIWTLFIHTQEYKVQFRWDYTGFNQNYLKLCKLFFQACSEIFALSSAEALQLFSLTSWPMLNLYFEKKRS